MEYENMRVAELKDELKKLRAPVSGNKSELVARLNQITKEVENVITLEDEDLLELNNRKSASSSIVQRMRTPVYGPLNLGAIIAIGISLLMLTTVLIVDN